MADTTRALLSDMIEQSDTTLVDTTTVSPPETMMADTSKNSQRDTTVASLSDTAIASQPDATVPQIQPKPAFKPNAIIGGGVMEATDADQEPQLIDEIEPEYPEAARAEGKSATVMLRLLVSKDGSVSKAEVLSGPELFHSAAIKVATQYEFEPGIHEDVPRDMWHDISIHFEPPE